MAQRMRLWAGFAMSCLAGGIVHAQACTTSFYQAYINCSSAICNNSVVQQLPDGAGEYGVRSICGTISCCGRSYPSCNPVGGNCPSGAQLTDPFVRQQLIDLAKTQDVMVNNCKGDFRPVEVALAERPIKPNADPALVVPKRAVLNITRGGE